MPMMKESRHDSAVGSEQGVPFAIGTGDVGKLNGSKGQFKRESRMVATGSGVQPALHGQIPYQAQPSHPDRW